MAFQTATFLAQFDSPRPRALLLDYDGTLAPFRAARDRAVMDPELQEIVQALCLAGRSRVVIISGRALRDLIPLLGIEPLPELWGSHGWERLLPSGEFQEPAFSRETAVALATARAWAESARLDGHLEIKPAGLALHWRGESPTLCKQLREQTRLAWEPLSLKPELELHDFDGGMELRVAGRDKGYAVAQVLRELPPDAIVAYAGDDYTDEDAFKTLSGHGLSILVRDSERATAADIRLRPSDEWIGFLRAWMMVDMEGGQR